MNKKVSRAGMLVIDVLLVVILLIADQFTKYLAIVRLKGKQPFVLIEGVLELDYLENRGSAFGMFQNQKVLLLSTGCIFIILLILFLLRLPEQRKYSVLHLLVAGIIAGGLGNMIDRIRFDYVVDFISFILINYPIFNVADICVVVSIMGLFVMIIFVYKEEDLEFLNFRKSKKTDS